MEHIKIILAIFALATGCAHGAASSETCASNPELQKQKSAELQKIVQADQKERLGSIDNIDWSKVSAEDKQRRAQVTQIFKDGCFKDAADYAAGALVYQHGDVPQDYYQTFLWANKAAKLGDKNQLWLAAAGIDRFLVKSGHKQLFGTQYFKDSGGPWCIEPIEPSFPDERRKEYRKTTLRESIANFLLAMKSAQSQDKVQDCAHNLEPTPQGTVQGFW